MSGFRDVGSSPLARGLPPVGIAKSLSTRIIPARAGFTTWPPPSPGLRSDHPRSRGVYPHLLVTHPRVQGSSPLARGLPPPCGASSPRVRIIPARAGFTSGPVSLPCGKAGSSPLARGLRREAPNRNRHSRIIPARAGFTTPCGSPTTTRQDHPRSRGVYPHLLVTHPRVQGSSPLARGLLRRPVRVGGVRRIIPARAGFTRSPPSRRGRAWDHPRSRGVYPRCSSIEFMAPGSSPLARGLPPSPRQCCPRPRDHPRSRGVYSRILFGAREGGGSSPLARGLHVGGDLQECADRIIPARAGFTRRRSRPPPPRWDHPRSRGVYDVMTASGWPVAGSSPLARGLPLFPLLLFL